jgi:hypothetical protein
MQRTQRVERQLMTQQPSPGHKYRVFVDDNFHYMDESERYELGEFDSCESAIAACKRLIDEFLVGQDAVEKTEEALFRLYTGFGGDPFIATTDTQCKFSAWEYAKQRCAEIAAHDSAH